MRLLFALLAIMALLASPMTAAAAQVACAEREVSSATAGVEMPCMGGMDHAKPDAPKGDSHPDSHKKPGMSCAQACASTCGAIALLPTTLVSIEPNQAASRIRPTDPVVLAPHDFGRLERPPKSLV